MSGARGGGAARSLARSGAGATVAALVSAAPLSAHHSVLPFDNARGTTIAGVVTRVLWQNPHALLVVAVEAAGGAVTQWLVESESPHALAPLGWTADSIAAGDRVTVLGAAAKDGSPALRCKQVTLADGQVLPCFPQ
jgi:hypothetical protein